MSRHYISTAPDEIVVGWDPPLQTYFLQISGPAKSEEEDELVLWLGASPGELPTVESLAAALAPYAPLPKELAWKLEEDKAESPLPSELQKFVIEMFASSEKQQR